MFLEERRTHANVFLVMTSGTSLADPGYKPFSLTHVEYPQDSLLGFIAAGLSLAPVFVIVALVTLILSRRDLHLLPALAGQLANTVGNLVLKKIIQQPRPEYAPSGFRAPPGGGSSFGMPSNHAQFMGFFCCYWLLFICRQKNAPRSPVLRLGCSVLLLLLGVAVTYSRVHLGYHSWEQVLVGNIVGSVAGIAWYWITWAVGMPQLRSCMSSRLFRLLQFKDLSSVEDVIEWECLIASAPDEKTWAALYPYHASPKRGHSD